MRNRLSVASFRAAYVFAWPKEEKDPDGESIGFGTGDPTFGLSRQRNDLAKQGHGQGLNPRRRWIDFGPGLVQGRKAKVQLAMYV
jgi:hypothetical protein